MMRERRAVKTRIIAVGLLALAACAEPISEPAPTPSPGSPDAADTTLSFEVVSQSAAELVVDLHYRVPDGQEGPRAAELWLSHSASVSLAASEPLAAADRADKQVIVQPRAGDELRVVLLSTTSLARLASGPLVRLRFALTDPAAGVRLELLERMPLFAPAEANRGVRLPDPLVLEGG